jgi:choline kinase
VLGKPIIVRMLEQLASCGVRVATIVDGYRSDMLRSSLGREFAGMTLEYIENTIYAETNSMYSLWMARETLATGAFVIEGDSLCGPGLVPALALCGTTQAFWAGQPYRGDMDGCVLTEEGEARRIIKQEIERNPVPGDKPHQYKSTGILSVSADYGSALAEWLDADVAAGNVNIYYDLVIGKHLQDKPIHIFDIGDEKWFEVDSVEDLRIAESLFGES